MQFPTHISLPYADVDAYAEYVRPLLSPWLRQAWVAIVDPATRTVTKNAYGAVTGVTVRPEDLIWVGWARVQPLRTAITLKRAIDSTTTRTTQFQLLDFPADGDVPDIRAGFEVVVMDGGRDPLLTEYQYYVTGSQNSSMAWQRTVETTVNQETRPDYDTTDWPQPPNGVIPDPEPDPEQEPEP